MKLLLAIDDSVPAEDVAAIRELSARAAAILGQPVAFSCVDPSLLRDLRSWIAIKTDGDGIAGIEPPVEPAAQQQEAPRKTA